MKATRFIIIALLVSFAVLTTPHVPKSHAQQRATSSACYNFPNLSSHQMQYAGMAYGQPGPVLPGETFTITASVEKGSAVIRLVGDWYGYMTLAGPVTVGSTPVTLSYTAGPTGLPAGAEGVVYIVDSTSTGFDSGVMMTVVTGCNLPGCDMGLPWSSDYVMGVFVADTTLAWGADQPITPPLTMQAGKTAWVLGQDATHEYYIIYWACSVLWVPVNSMGPDPEQLWNSRPLPTNVVE
ncbi:MAG TPA: hypothetical protein VHP83_16765 [Aggregatilineaceae bacterium]|nr:hypothetical protein [Aggregatilineaceae bacterium]